MDCIPWITLALFRRRVLNPAGQNRECLIGNAFYCFWRLSGVGLSAGWALFWLVLVLAFVWVCVWWGCGSGSCKKYLEAPPAPNWTHLKCVYIITLAFNDQTLCFICYWFPRASWYKTGYRSSNDLHHRPSEQCAQGACVVVRGISNSSPPPPLTLF